MDKVKGSMDVLSSMQLTEDMAGLDAQSKALLRHREVLAVILGEVVAEYKGYSRKEVTDVTGLGECVYRDGLEKGIQAMILDNVEEEVPIEKILIKLQKHFNLPLEKAEQYYKRFALNE